MAVTIPGTITGTAQVGFTSPSATTAVDVSPFSNGKQVAISAVTGMPLVTTHSMSSPFTLNFFKPVAAKVLGAISTVTGRLQGKIPRNNYGLITRKGVTPAAGQPPVAMIVRTTIEVPAGADTYDAANVRAALSVHFGALSTLSSGIGDTTVTGIF